MKKYGYSSKIEGNEPFAPSLGKEWAYKGSIRYAANLPTSER